MWQDVAEYEYRSHEHAKVELGANPYSTATKKNDNWKYFNRKKLSRVSNNVIAKISAVLGP